MASSHTQLFLVLVALLAYATAQSFTGPYAQRVVDQVPKIGSTDGSFLESQFFYDMPTGTRVSSMNVTIDLKYGGKNENLRVWFFLRRYAPFDKERDLKHWTEKCQLSQAYPNNMNPYDCEMEEVIVNSGPQEAYVPAKNLTLIMPRTGRYFLFLVPEDDLDSGETIDYEINFRGFNCAPDLGGDGCEWTVDTLDSDGTMTEEVTGTVPQGQWKYWLFNVNPGIAQFQVQNRAGARGTDGGYYLRYGNTPTYCNITKALNANQNHSDVVFANLPCKTDWWFEDFTGTNWQNPFAGNYYVGVYGGDSEDGYDYEFKIVFDTCEEGMNGAYCTHTRQFNQCPTINSVTCTSTDKLLDANSIEKTQSITVNGARWSYFHFALADNYYSVSVTAQIADYEDGDQVSVVVGPGGVPENNAEEGSPQYPLGAIWVVSGEFSDDKAHKLDTYYAAAATGYFYVGFFSKSSDTREFTVTWKVAIDDCPGGDCGDGVCNTVRSGCDCPPDEDNIDPITCASLTDSSSSGGGGGLSTGSIVALSICIPLAVIIVLGIIGGGLYYVKFRQGYETIQ